MRPPLFYNYGYDQLNRLLRMRTFKGFSNSANTWTPVAINDYQEDVVYDPNGNILNYRRNGAPEAGAPETMDDLTYEYYSSKNQLKRVTDAVSAGNYTEDIDSQTETENYVYDAIGNLVEDKSEGLEISWNVYGKISQIEKSAGTIVYRYDAGGNRVSKSYDGKTTIYVRDASGNVLSVYEKEDEEAISLAEVHLYGSTRLGMVTQRSVTDSLNISLSGGFETAKELTFTRTEKIFELSNYLGNVLVTVSDRRLSVNDGEGVVAYYEVDVVTANDYYPGGMQLPGRTFQAGSSSYRYSINGQEKTPEIAPNTTTAEFWQYDARIVRRWNVDPKTKVYESPYLAFGGSPINVIDPNGADSVKINGKWSGVWKSEKGNTLSGLAKTFGTSTETIERLNPNVDFDNLSEGTAIRVQGETTIFGASDGALAIQQKGALEVNPLLNYKMNFLYNQLQQDGYINFMIESLGVTANIGIANSTISSITIGMEGNQNQNVVIDNVNQLLTAFGLKVEMDLGIRIQPGIIKRALEDFDLTKTIVNSNFKKGYRWFGQIKPVVTSEMQKASKGASLQVQTYTNIMIETISQMFARGNMHDWTGDDPDQVTLKGESFFSPGTQIYHKYLGITIDKQ